MQLSTVALQSPRPFLIRQSPAPYATPASVNRYTGSDEEGDQGGNKLILDGADKNLHAFWDHLAGRDLDRRTIAPAGDELMRLPPAEVERLDVESWMNESFDVTQRFVHTATAPVFRKTARRAREIARRRLNLAGHRLAAVLNDRLQ